MQLLLLVAIWYEDFGSPDPE